MVIVSTALDVTSEAQLGVSSLIDLDFEQNGEVISSEKLLVENRQLQAALSKAEQAVREMRQVVAVGAGEVEIYRRQAIEIKKRVEALGGSVSGSQGKLEQRLLSSVSEIQQLEFKNSALVAAIIRLTEAMSQLKIPSGSSDGTGQLVVEEAIREARAALGVSNRGVEALAVALTLGDGAVISVKEEMLLVVANLGRAQGVRVGMPFRVIRGNNIVGSVRVVEVRERFAGAVVQSLISVENRIRIGDRLIVETQP